MRFNREASATQDHDEAGVDDAVITLEPGHDAPSIARAFVADHRDHLPGDLLDDAQLLVSEVVTNAVQHGRGAIVLRVRAAPPGIGIAVADTGDTIAGHSADAPRQPATDATSGRGLAIIAAVADAWGVVDTEPRPGKTIWFELCTPASASD